MSEVANFGVAVLGSAVEHGEGLVFGDLVAFHDDAERLADALPGADRGAAARVT
ncbi:hypothetical protein [Saccharopolyspora cebuensis]|uniref:Uncharacterized protein n=1 Tax=Saccharopolyspora cebuensis TaxID=418759 RepID=A0ABV4CW42_9PSEU